MTRRAEAAQAPRFGRAASVAFVIALGLSSGAVGAYIVGQSSASRGQNEHSAGATAERTIALAPPGASDGTNAKLHALESRLKDLESAKEARQAGAQPKKSGSAEGTNPEQNWEAWKNELRAHAEEPRDPTWASKTQGLFSEDLGTMTGRGAFEVLSVECKTTSCSAKLKWPDYPTAQSAADLILHQRYRANCGREVHLPPPESDQESKPYEATVLYTCEEWRASQT